MSTIRSWFWSTRNFADSPSNPQGGGSSTSKPEVRAHRRATASVRVDKRGAVHIPSSELAELPEVIEMQRLARSIVCKARSR
ncbi:hypothetical protein D2048_17405 [Morganella morganii]|nr:hypothetical protein D2048_17405 [Morganella morganii]